MRRARTTGAPPVCSHTRMVDDLYQCRTGVVSEPENAKSGPNDQYVVTTARTGRFDQVPEMLTSLIVDWFRPPDVANWVIHTST